MTEKLKKPQGKRQKALSLIVTGVCVLLTVFALTVIIIALVAKRNKRPAVLFGYSYSIVLTDSMSPEIAPGELLTVKPAKLSAIKAGQNAVFRRDGKYIVHRVIRLGSDERGAYIVTQGIKDGAPEDAPVYESEIYGIAVGHSLFWGKFLGFFARPANWFLIVAMIGGIPLIAYCVKLVIRYSKEHRKELKEEKERERAEMKEALRRELSEEQHVQKTPSEGSENNEEKKE